MELLHLRFDEGLPIREIARLWEVDPAQLHYEYAKARKEFKNALMEVLSFHHPGGPTELERESARRLLDDAQWHVKTAIVMHRLSIDRAEASRRLDACDGFVRRVISAGD